MPASAPNAVASVPGRVADQTRGITLTPISRSGGSLDLVGTNQKISRNLPRFADLVNHLDRERSPARKNLRRARARVQKFCQLGLGMAELVYGIPEHVDRIEGFVDLDRPSLGFVDFDEREQHIELVTLLRALSCAPTSLDRRERCAVILVCANGPDVHGRLLRTAIPSTHRCDHIPRRCR